MNYDLYLFSCLIKFYDADFEEEPYDYQYDDKGLLLIEKDRNYIFYYANKSSKDFIDLSRIYWRNQTTETIDYLNKNIHKPYSLLNSKL